MDTAAFRNEAAERASRRADAFIDIPRLLYFGGPRIVQLTPERRRWLDGLGNPILHGGSLTKQAVREACWILSPGWVPTCRWRQLLWDFRYWTLNYQAAAMGLRKSIWTAFENFPQQPSKPRSAGAGEYDEADAGDLDAGIIAALHPWTEAEVQRIPYARLFQYISAKYPQQRSKHIPSFRPSDEARAAELRTRLGLNN